MRQRFHIGVRRAMQRACTAAVVGLCACLAHGQELISPVISGNAAPFSVLDIHWISESASLDDERREMCADVLEGARISMLAAQREMELASWLNDVSRTETDPDKSQKVFSRGWLEVYRKFRVRREKIEREFLTDLRAASGASHEEWARYEQRRRLHALRVSGELALIDLASITRSLPLSSSEEAAVDRGMREMEAAIEPHVREFMKVAAKFTDVLTEVEQISDYEDPQSKALYEKYHALNTQKSAESQKITQAAARAVKMIIAELSPENAAELQRRMDVSRLQTLASMLRFVEDPVISDLLRISTLTREQRSSMRALVRKTQSETIGQFKEMLSAYEMWAAGKEVTTEIDYEALMAKHLKITRELRDKLSGELNPQQKIAFEEGIEPPLSWNARRSGEEIERAR